MVKNHLQTIKQQELWYYNGIRQKQPRVIFVGGHNDPDYLKYYNYSRVRNKAYQQQLRWLAGQTKGKSHMIVIAQIINVIINYSKRVFY
jgi:hypothetical protein